MTERNNYAAKLGQDAARALIDKALPALRRMPPEMRFWWFIGLLPGVFRLADEALGRQRADELHALNAEGLRTARDELDAGAAVPSTAANDDQGIPH